MDRNYIKMLSNLVKKKRHDERRFCIEIVIIAPRTVFLPVFKLALLACLSKGGTMCVHEMKLTLGNRT